MKTLYFHLLSPCEQLNIHIKIIGAKYNSDQKITTVRAKAKLRT